MAISLNDDVRGGKENGQRSNNGEESENDETNTVYYHGGEFPICYQIVIVLFLLQTRSNEAQFSDYGL